MPRILQACNFKIGDEVYTDYIGWERKYCRWITKIEKQRCQTGFMLTTKRGKQILRLDAGWYHHQPPLPKYAKKESFQRLKRS